MFLVALGRRQCNNYHQLPTLLDTSCKSFVHYCFDTDLECNDCSRWLDFHLGNDQPNNGCNDLARCWLDTAQDHKFCSSSVDWLGFEICPHRNRGSSLQSNILQTICREDNFHCLPTLIFFWRCQRCLHGSLI